MCEDGNEPPSFIKYGEIQKYRVELPSSAHGLGLFEVFSKFGDWLRYGNSVICNKFPLLRGNVIAHQDGQPMLEPVIFCE
jgi:hypothetical protein